MPNGMSTTMYELIQEDAKRLEEEIDYYSAVLREKEDELRRCEDALAVLKEEVVKVHE